ncbi:MAG: transposase [Candidatus Obscuribacterales bacterium]|nr:transposase [Candidatus Obscuribacterales bacterium]
MTNNRDYNREEITTILRLHRAGVSASEICSTHNISEHSFLRLQNLYGSGLSKFAKTRQPAKAQGPLIEKLLNRRKP